MSGSTLEHQKLVDAILFEVGSLPNVRLWPRQVGFDQEKKIKYGIRGESDLQGIIAPQGRMLCIEVKSGKAKLSKDQERWKAMVLRFGGVHIEARSVDQVLADLKPHL